MTDSGWRNSTRSAAIGTKHAKNTWRSIAKTRGARDLETLNRRPQYLIHFATKSLSRNRSAGNEQALADVQDVVDELKQIQPDAIATLALAGGTLPGSQPTRQGRGTDSGRCRSARSSPVDTANRWRN